MDLIDGYTHCGLSKYEPIERVEEVMAVAGVSRAVLVQHLGELDNSYLARIATDKPERFAAVGLVDHEPADCLETLRRWVEVGRFKGMRLTSDALAVRPALAEAVVQAGLIVVLYVPRGVAPVADALEPLFDRHPDARLVLSHLAQPDPAESPEFANWQDTLRLAAHPGVYLQLSGMKMSCPWPHEPIYPLIEQAIERFGPARVYWGSNFPVVGGADDYIKDLSLLLNGRLPIAAQDIPAVAGGNAKMLWFQD
ncbi:MAG TPA: amidohydrolase family protein [Pirellulales bacterium]|jgi:L-fuconolactonase|nr:amidohydrolase family protein [Pirellulales bacterium]